jgi:hypothetical protein
MSGLAIPYPKIIFGMDSLLGDGEWNIWFKAKDADTMQGLPNVETAKELPVSGKKVTLLKTIKDETNGRYALQIRIEPKAEGSMEAGISARSILFIFAGILLVTGAFYLTFDKVENVVEEGGEAVFVWGLVALAVVIFFIIRWVRK